MSISRTLLFRFLASVWIFLLVSAILFLAIETLPGDYASASAPRFSTWDEIETERDRIGLNTNPVLRYFEWLGRSLQGDLGVSWFSQREIAPDLYRRFIDTALLALLSAMMAIPLGFFGGIVAVVCRNSFVDRAVSTLSLTAISMPEFLVAYALMAIFVVSIPTFPAHVVFYDAMRWDERLWGMILPAASLAIIALAPVLRQTRASIIGVMSSPYIEMARLKGLGRWRIVLHHALPNAVGPIVNMVLLVVANFFVGAVIVEQIFSYPGIGSLLLPAVKFQDQPLVLALGLVFAIVFISLNLAADVVSIVFNPRLRHAPAARVRLRWREMSLGRWFTRRRFAVITGLVAALGFWSSWPEPEDYFIVDGLSTPSETRDELTISEMFKADPAAVKPLHFAHFMPLGEQLPAADLALRIRVQSMILNRRIAFDAEAVTSRIELPGFEFSLLGRGGIALPLKRDQFIDTDSPAWQVILSAGIAWSESAERGWTRVALPFTLLRNSRLALMNGVILFALRGDRISPMRVQIAQEGQPDNAKVNWWGQARLDFETIAVPARARIFAAYDAERATDFELGSWDALERRVGRGRLRGFDNPDIRRHVSLSGLLLDDILYLRACPTRYGPNPFCEQLRHPVFSVSKSIGAGLAMLRLAQKYGAAVFAERIDDYVALSPPHDGWNQVTFGDALNMATGVGDVVPRRIDDYVEADFSRREMWIWNEPEIDDKLSVISGYDNYPWGPGEVLRYKSSDTMLLAIAMDRLLRAREGEDYGLIQMLTAEIFEPLGIGPLPIRMMDDGPSRSGVPQFGGGMLPNIQQVAKLARLFANSGVFNGQQILHRQLTVQAISTDMDRGLPSGYRFADGSEANYDMSFWLAPYRAEAGCKLRVPQMVGYGGNYVSLMPNNTIGFRFADGLENVTATYDSAGIRAVSDRVRSFCP